MSERIHDNIHLFFCFAFDSYAWTYVFFSVIFYKVILHKNSWKKNVPIDPSYCSILFHLVKILKLTEIRQKSLSDTENIEINPKYNNSWAP